MQAEVAGVAVMAEVAVTEAAVEAVAEVRPLSLEHRVSSCTLYTFGL